MATIPASPGNEPWRLSPSRKERIFQDAKSPEEGRARIEAYENELKWAFELTNDEAALRRELQTFLRELQVSKGRDLEFAKTISQLNNFLERFESRNGKISKAMGNHIADALLSLYDFRHQVSKIPTNPIINLIARYSTSTEGKKFIIARLSDAPLKTRDELVRSLAWNSRLRGDTVIFNALAKYYYSSTDKDVRILGTLARLDSKKALPVLQKEIEQANNIQKFIRLSSAISEYDDPRLLRPVLLKALEFPPKPFGTGRNPATGIYPSVLLAFIDQAESGDLELGLQVLEQTAIALNQSYPVLIRKLDSHNPSSRAAVLRTLRKAFLLGAFVNVKTAQNLETKAKNEKNPTVIEEFKNARQVLREKMH